MSINEKLTALKSEMMVEMAAQRAELQNQIDHSTELETKWSAIFDDLSTEIRQRDKRETDRNLAPTSPRPQRQGKAVSDEEVLETVVPLPPGAPQEVLEPEEAETVVPLPPGAPQEVLEPEEAETVVPLPPAAPQEDDVETAQPSVSSGRGGGGGGHPPKSGKATQSAKGVKTKYSVMFGKEIPVEAKPKKKGVSKSGRGERHPGVGEKQDAAKDLGETPGTVDTHTTEQARAKKTPGVLLKEKADQQGTKSSKDNLAKADTSKPSDSKAGSDNEGAGQDRRMASRSGTAGPAGSGGALGGTAGPAGSGGALGGTAGPAGSGGALGGTAGPAGSGGALGGTAGSSGTGGALGGNTGPSAGSGGGSLKDVSLSKWKFPIVDGKVNIKGWVLKIKDNPYKVRTVHFKKPGIKLVQVESTLYPVRSYDDLTEGLDIGKQLPTHTCEDNGELYVQVDGFGMIQFEFKENHLNIMYFYGKWWVYDQENHTLTLRKQQLGQK